MGRERGPLERGTLSRPKPHLLPENFPQPGFILTAHFDLLCDMLQSTGNVQRYEARLREVFYDLVGW